MKFVDDDRDVDTVRRLAATLARKVSPPWILMEICGGQTHSIIKFGLDELLPARLTLVHGPGCPVCVTPVALMDAAVAAGFHVSLAAAITAAAQACGIAQVELTGGCFQNALLLELASSALSSAGQALGARWGITTVATSAASK